MDHAYDQKTMYFKMQILLSSPELGNGAHVNSHPPDGVDLCQLLCMGYTLLYIIHILLLVHFQDIASVFVKIC